MKFNVGIGRYRLGLRECRSLKDKRQILKSIIDRLGNSKAVAACEVSENDYWKSSVLAVASVSRSFDVVTKSLGNARKIIEATGVEILDEQKYFCTSNDFEW